MRLLCPGGSRFVLDFIQLRTFGLDSRQAIKTLIWKGLSCYLQDISEMFLEFRHTKVSKKEFATMRVFSKNNLACFLAIALTFSQFGSVTRAADVVDVSSLPPNIPADPFHDIKLDSWYANAFTINSASGKFSTIFLALDPSDNPPPPSIDKAASLDVNVYASNPDGSVNYTPMGFRGEFLYNPVVGPYPGTVANAPYSLKHVSNQDLELSAGKYWIVVSANGNLASNDSVSWLKKNQNTNVNGSYASILPDIRQYNVTNGSWSEVQSGSQMMRFAINNPVPEPSTYVLGAVMAGVLAFVNRYQARQKMAVKPSV